MAVFVRWTMRIVATVITLLALAAIRINMPTMPFHVALGHFLVICGMLLFAMALAIGSLEVTSGRTASSNQVYKAAAQAYAGRKESGRP